jgi:NDP-sugar pyrophosphorylase family protein
MISAITPETTEVVVLCGGRGARLGALTDGTPKPLLPVNGAPFLLHRLIALRQEGFSHVILAAHYLVEQFRRFARTYAGLLPQVTVIAEPTPLGTGGALRSAVDHVRSSVFVALNGDSWGLQCAAPVLAEHSREGHRFTMVVVRAEHVEGGARQKGLVSCGPRGELLGLTTGDSLAEHWINAGLYILNRELVNAWPSGSYDLERELTSLVPPGAGYVFYSPETLLDIGTPECYARALHSPLGQVLEASGPHE